MASSSAGRGLAACCLIAVLSLGSVGCHSAPPAPRMVMQLATQPPVPGVGGDTTFTLRVRDGQGHPLTGASARLALEMTFMNMGSQVVQLGERSPGVYVGQGRFPMGGDWDCRALVQRGAVRGEQIFHYKIG